MTRPLDEDETADDPAGPRLQALHRLGHRRPRHFVIHVDGREVMSLPVSAPLDFTVFDMLKDAGYRGVGRVTEIAFDADGTPIPGASISQRIPEALTEDSQAPSDPVMDIEIRHAIDRALQLTDDDDAKGAIQAARDVLTDDSAMARRVIHVGGNTAREYIEAILSDLQQATQATSDLNRTPETQGALQHLSRAQGRLS